MTLSEIFGPEILDRVSRYVLKRASDGDRQRLLEAAEGIASEIDVNKLKEDAEALLAAQERGRQIDALEKLTSKIARGLVRAAVRIESESLPVETKNWISHNITSSTDHAPRVLAIWRHEAGLGNHDDDRIFDVVIESARTGKSIVPTATAGTEDTMTDPIDIRNAVLERAAFNPAGLPKALRETANQEIYLDAVVQATALLGHGPEEDDAVAWAGCTAALLLLDGHFNPQDYRFFAHAQKAVAELSSSAKEDGQVEIDSHNLSMTAPEEGKTQRFSIFTTAFQILEGHVTTDNARVFLQSFAQAGRKAVERYDLHQGNGELMSHVVRATYDAHTTKAGSGGGGGAADLDIPPLNDPAGFNDEIEPDNIRSVSTIYVTYQLEFALKAASRLLELFVAGLLPIPASDTSARELDELYWDQDELLDEASRRSVYARVLGAPGGEMSFDIQPNNEFNTLLMRVVSAVSEYEREQSVLTHFDNAGRGRRFQSTSGEFVRKAIRDFAANASLRGWAGTVFTAERMAGHVGRVMRILNLPAVKNAFGVTTPWQVVERVSQREFGITVNTVLHRTLAVETQTIMRIIADHHTVWSNGSGTQPLFPEIDVSRVDGFPRANIIVQGDLSPETTRELMVACQHFRAVTGVGDALLDEYSDPVEAAAQPSLPDIGGIGGMTGGALPGIDMGGIDQLRDMVNSGQAPSMEQLRSMLPGF